MFSGQGAVDESLMHSKGIVDLALFSSGIHILTLRVLLLPSEKCGRIKWQNATLVSSLGEYLIIEESYLERPTQTICFGLHLCV